MQNKSIEECWKDLMEASQREWVKYYTVPTWEQLQKNWSDLGLIKDYGTKK